MAEKTNRKTRTRATRVTPEVEDDVVYVSPEIAAAQNGERVSFTVELAE